MSNVEELEARGWDKPVEVERGPFVAPEGMPSAPEGLTCVTMSADPITEEAEKTWGMMMVQIPIDGPMKTRELRERAAGSMLKAIKQRQDAKDAAEAGGGVTIQG